MRVFMRMFVGMWRGRLRPRGLASRMLMVVRMLVPMRMGVGMFMIVLVSSVRGRGRPRHILLCPILFAG